MDEEDLAPQRQRPKPRDLTPVGVEELETYIEGLRAEIARAEAEIASKKKQRAGAAQLFKR